MSYVVPEHILGVVKMILLEIHTFLSQKKAHEIYF